MPEQVRTLVRIGSAWLTLAFALLLTVSVTSATTLSERDAQIAKGEDLLEAVTQHLNYLGQAQEHTARIPLIGTTFSEITVATVTRSSAPMFTLQLRFTNPQVGIQSVEWRTTRLDHLTTLIELLQGNQIDSLMVQTKEATATGVTPCTNCDLRGWLYRTSTLASGGRP